VFLSFLVNLVKINVDELLELGSVVEIEGFVGLVMIEHGERISGLHLLRNI
jgi:hypothetical protein